MALTKRQRQLIFKIREKANLETFAGGFTDAQLASITSRSRSVPDDGNEIRAATRIYRDSWLNPLFDELLHEDVPNIFDKKGKG